MNTFYYAPKIQMNGENLFVIHSLKSCKKFKIFLVFHLDITNGTGFISKCLMANADTLCAGTLYFHSPFRVSKKLFYDFCKSFCTF